MSRPSASKMAEVRFYREQSKKSKQLQTLYELFFYIIQIQDFGTLIQSISNSDEWNDSKNQVRFAFCQFIISPTETRAECMNAVLCPVRDDRNLSIHVGRYDMRIGSDIRHDVWWMARYTLRQGRPSLSSLPFAPSLSSSVLAFTVRPVLFASPSFSLPGISCFVYWCLPKPRLP